MPSSDTQFKKGQVANPTGRPKGTGLFQNFVKRALEELGEDDFLAWIKETSENKADFYKGIAARTLPKPVEVSGPDGGPVERKYTVEIIRPKEGKE